MTEKKPTRRRTKKTEDKTEKPKRTRKTTTKKTPRKSRARKSPEKKIEVPVAPKVEVDADAKVIKKAKAVLSPSKKKIVPHELLQVVESLVNRVEYLEKVVEILIKK